MQMTGYKVLQSLGKCAPDYIGGICQWFYTPIQNIIAFPAIDPLSQQLTAAPTASVWYGPVNVPDKQRGWKQTVEKSKAGPWKKQLISGFVPGNSTDSHLNIDNLLYHQFCVMALLRAGGFWICIGNNITGMELDADGGTGEGAADTPGTKISLGWEGDALIVPTFSGITSMTPPVGGATVNIGAAETKSLTYICDGSEGTVLNLSALSGKTILLFSRENDLLDVVNTTPVIREVEDNGSGFFTVLVPFAAGEKIKVLFK